MVMTKLDWVAKWLNGIWGLYSGFGWFLTPKNNSNCWKCYDSVIFTVNVTTNQRFCMSINAKRNYLRTCTSHLYAVKPPPLLHPCIYMPACITFISACTGGGVVHEPGSKPGDAGPEVDVSSICRHEYAPTPSPPDPRTIGLAPLALGHLQLYRGKRHTWRNVVRYVASPCDASMGSSMHFPLVIISACVIG